MERKIPIEWLEEWAKITDNEGLMEILLTDWVHDENQKPFWLSKDKLIRDDVVLRVYNNHGQFSPDNRRHYDVELIATDYDDEGNHPKDTVILKDIRHSTQKELEEYAREQTVQQLGEHDAVSFVAKPREFVICECFRNWYISHPLQKNTKVSSDGQIGFKL